jgi:hypothetical protein
MRTCDPDFKELFFILEALRKTTIRKAEFIRPKPEQSGWPFQMTLGGTFENSSMITS